MCICGEHAVYSFNGISYCYDCFREGVALDEDERVGDVLCKECGEILHEDADTYGNGYCWWCFKSVHRKDGSLKLLVPVDPDDEFMVAAHN